LRPHNRLIAKAEIDNLVRGGSVEQTAADTTRLCICRRRNRRRNGPVLRGAVDVLHEGLPRATPATSRNWSRVWWFAACPHRGRHRWCGRANLFGSSEKKSLRLRIEERQASPPEDDRSPCRLSNPNPPYPMPPSTKTFQPSARASFTQNMRGRVVHSALLDIRLIQIVFIIRQN